MQRADRRAQQSTWRPLLLQIVENVDSLLAAYPSYGMWECS